MIYNFTPAEQAQLAPYTTNTDRPIFGLRNLPEAVKAALFARYSRTNKDLRRVLLDDFLDVLQGPQQTFDTSKADAFHDRVLNEYGDDSVAELGGAHIAVEGVSQLAALALCDNRIGISLLVKSTRYVDFSQKINGCYQYTVPQFDNPEHETAYYQAMDGLFDAYSQLQKPLIAYLEQVNPRGDEIDIKAYNRAIKARALDALRGLLPLGALTNLGLYGNGRAFDHLLAKLQASDHMETMRTGYAIEAELNQLIPSLIKKKHHRQAHVRYLKEQQSNIVPMTIRPAPTGWRHEECEIFYYDDDAYDRVANDIDLRMNWYSDNPQEAITVYLGDRPTRHIRPGRAFEKTRYMFNIVSSIGCYRDLQRHRMTLQTVQSLTCNLGYDIPALVMQANLQHPYAAAITQGIKAYEQCPRPELIPLGMRCMYEVEMNLREAYHFIELRSQGNGHPEYRKIAQAMYEQIKAVHPVFAQGMKFVDLEDYELGRLNEK